VLEIFRTRRFDVGGGPPIPLTVSVGAASFPDHALSSLGLLEAADRAMYQAKAGGRDAVMLFT
jgi:diguanylate cyclase (GGDEF)-like protein